jgi:DNA-binding NarL/FixJ family response regulator
MTSRPLDKVRALVPASKIIFVTQESSADVLRKALSLGACGYVVNARAESEFLSLWSLYKGLAYCSALSSSIVMKREAYGTAAALISEVEV